MKKSILGLVLFVLAAQADVLDYKKGFENALEALKLQVKLNDITCKKIDFKENNVVWLDISNLNTTRILLIQYLASNEDFKNIKLGIDKMFLGSYNRKADAIYFQERAEKLFRIDAYVSKKEDLTDEYTNPLFIKYILENNIDSIDANGSLIIEKPVFIEKTIIAKKDDNSSIKTKYNYKVHYFKLKNKKAQSYKLKKGTSYRFVNNFEEDELVENDEQVYKYAQTFWTREGLVFIKVFNKNIYFLLSDIIKKDQK